MEDLTQLLTDDLLADILRRVGARGLAASRRVCKAWTATVDAHGLLRPHLLPHSLAGIFINFNELRYSELFSRPAPSSSSSTGAPGKKIAAYPTVHDHCNGLLLLLGWVVNPATGWSAPLPPRPPPVDAGMEYFVDDDYLAYDPAVSPAHYQVFLIPNVPELDEELEPEVYELELIDPAMMGSEWPPSRHVLRVFSSATGRWEERTFLREGEAAGTVADMAADCTLRKCNAVCWRGALYVYCRNGFVMKISLSDDTYKVIRPPGDFELAIKPDLQLGRSEKGVYCAFFSDCRVRVWILNESSNQKYEWVLKHDRPGLPSLSRLNQHGRQGQGGAWTLQDANFIEDKYCYNIELDKNNATDTTVIDQGKREWSSDDDDYDGLNTEDMVADPTSWTTILGFHPFKEIVFLSKNFRRGFAYHLNTSKVQDLGNLQPKHYNYITGPRGFIGTSFLYTPCLMPLTNVIIAAEDPKKRRQILRPQASDGVPEATRTLLWGI